MSKKRSISFTAICMVAGQSVLMVGVCLLVAVVFFGRLLSSVYDDMNASITGAALGAVNEGDMKSLAEEVDAVVRSKEFSPEEYENSKEEWISDFKRIEESEVYRRVWEELNTIRQGTISTAMDYVLIYPEKGMEVFILDACDVNVLPCGETHIIDTEPYMNGPRQDFDGFITHSSTYGRLRTDGTAVVLDPERGIYAYLLSDIPVSNVSRGVRSFLLQTALCALIATVVISIGVVVLLRSRVVKPIGNISDTAEMFVGNYELRAAGRDNSHIFESMEGSNITELHNLTSALKSMELEIGSYLSDLDRLAMERARLDTELNLARRIQAGVLSTEFDPIREKAGVDIFATMAPAKEVGGDFYDFFMTDDGHLCLVIADVSGKGVPAALFMMVAKALIKNRMKSGDSPSEALFHVNNQICEYNIGSMFVTVWACLIDVMTGASVSVNAGHEHPVVRRCNEGFELVRYRHCPAVGVMEGTVYSEHSFSFGKGDLLFVYTDGLPEAENREEEMYGTTRMMGFLNRHRDEDPEKLLLSVKRNVGEFVGEREPFDDLTMMAVKWER